MPFNIAESLARGRAAVRDAKLQMQMATVQADEQWYHHCSHLEEFDKAVEAHVDKIVEARANRAVHRDSAAKHINRMKEIKKQSQEDQRMRLADPDYTP